MRLVLLGQPEDEVVNAAAELATTVEVTCCVALDQAPDWSVLEPHDLLLLLERFPTASVDWRHALASCAHSFQVIYASEQPLLQELQWALGHHLHRITGYSPWPLRAEITPRWQGVCESCSDPECEHRLFRRLVAARPNPA